MNRLDRRVAGSGAAASHAPSCSAFSLGLHASDSASATDGCHLYGYGPPDLHLLGQGPGQGDVVDRHDPVLPGNLLDARGRGIVTICHDHRGGHLHDAVFGRDGHVGGPGSDEMQPHRLVIVDFFA